MSTVLAERKAIPSQLRHQVVFAVGLGMLVNVASISFGNPYIVSLSVLGLVPIATFVWATRPLPWLTLAAVIAANPVNRTAPISLNLLFAITFLILSPKCLRRLPKPLILVTLLAMLSVFGSFFFWTMGISFESLFNQGAAVTNYLLGPFLLIPLIFSRIKSKHDSLTLLKILVFALIVPTIVLLVCTLAIGEPVSLTSVSEFDDVINSMMYRLGHVEFNLTRTQVGIVLASLICASFAVAITKVARFPRVTAAVGLFVSTYLLIITGSVGSILASIGGIILILLVAKLYFPIGRIILIVAIGVGLVITSWFLIPEGVQGYVEHRYEQRFAGRELDFSDRIELWQQSFNYLAHNPLGEGWSLFIENLGIYPHNDYLTYAIAFGFFSGVLYLFVPAGILFSLVKEQNVGDPNRLALKFAGLGTATVLLINSFSDHLTANRWYFNVTWSLIWFTFFASNTATRSKFLPGVNVALPTNPIPAQEKTINVS